MKKLTLLFLFLSTNLSFAKSIAVASSHPLVTQTAIDVLNENGSAVDALIASSFVLNVVQPYKMGIGGGGILVLFDGKTSITQDHREMAPLSSHEKMFLDEKENPIPYDKAITGPNPVGIPGTVKGLYEIHKKYGKKKWKDLLKPAIQIAKNGFPITKFFTEEIIDNWDRLLLFPITASIFSNGEGHPMLERQILKQPLLANTLTQIAENGGEDFYTGNLAKSWTLAAQKEGVKITLDDLKLYKTRTNKPIDYEVFNFKAITAHPPSSSGILVAEVLRFLENYYQKNQKKEALSAERIIVTSEALLFYQKLRDEKLADLPFTKILPEKYINSVEEKEDWKKIEEKIKEKILKIKKEVTKNENHDFYVKNIKPISHTAHISIVDSNFSVAYTTTIEALFGSGITVPQHGFLLNNELTDFNFKPGHPNSPAPLKRPKSNMSPTIFLEKVKNSYQPVAVIGCAGGSGIPTSIVETLENYYIFKLDANVAAALTRFHPISENVLEVEKNLPKSIQKELEEAGYKIQLIDQMWSVLNALLRRSHNDKWEAVSEPRYDGMAIRL